MQKDSLLFSIARWHKLQANFLNEHETGTLDSSIPETSAVLRVLDAKQFDAYLHLKNKEKAANNAMKDWMRLKEQKIKADSSKTYGKLYAYHLGLLAATDKVFFSPAKENVLARASWQANMKPQVLSDLEKAEKKKRDAALNTNFFW